MSKQVLRNYEFDAAAGTLTFPDFDEDMDLAGLALVTNVSKGQLLYNFMDPTLRGSIEGNVLTLLDVDTSGMDGDVIRVDYDTSFGDVSYDRLVVGNARTKFRDGFATSGVVQPNPDSWTLDEDVPGSHIINQGGDSSGSSYLRISLSPFVEANGLSITSKRAFAFPMRVGFGVSISQRVVGQEIFIGMVAGEDGVIPELDPVPDKAITGATISVTSNVATVTMTRHGFKGGDRVIFFNCADHRMNVGPVAVTPITADTFTVSLTIANGSYNSTGGMVRTADPLRYARNGAGLLFENATTTNASLVTRRNGAKFRSENQTIGSTTATQANTAAYTDAFNAATNQELYFSMDELVMRSFASDSNSSTNGYKKYTQGVPDEELPYHIHVRARNLNGFSLPVARVLTVAKSGSTTATVTTDGPHGLSAGDYVQIYGVLNQATFANLSTQTGILTTPTADSFTITWGSSATANSVGGVVWSNQGQVAAPGVFAQAIQSMSRTNDVLTLIGSATWATPLPGEFVHVWGVDPAARDYEGAYKVLRVSTTTLELEAPGDDFTSISTGGAVIRRTDIRLHFSKVMDYTRLVSEIVGGKGNTSDANGAVPVALASGTVATSQSTGANTTQWNAAGWAGFLVADIASAAITTTATSAAITPGTVGNIGMYSATFHVGVTAISGASAAMDVAIEESPDNGTTWVRVYEFPRITATGNYYSPQLRMTWGTRIRYVRTVSGTTPSVTNVVNRLMFSHQAELIRQFFDRTIVLTTLNSATPIYVVDGCNYFQVVVSLGAATTPPVLQLQGSEDGGSWYNIGGTFTPAANASTVQVAQDVMPRFVRVIVATAGATVTMNWVSVKGYRK